jgi:hypothetical protein
LKDAPEAVLGPPQGDESPVVFGPEVLEGRAPLAVDGGRMAEKGYAAASDQGSPKVWTFKTDEHENTHPRVRIFEYRLPSTGDPCLVPLHPIRSVLKLLLVTRHPVSSISIIGG